MPRKAPRKLLFSIHGIRTLGAWQDALEAELAGRGWKHEPFRYGYFSVVRFLRAASRRAIVEAFHDWYIRKSAEFISDERHRKLNRPSIVAHSFGSYVVGMSMLKYREIRFDKIILCGSILPPDFDWMELLARNQVWRVRNEFGLLDKWARAVKKFVPGTGDSGFGGFEYASSCIESQRFDYHEHSDYFKLGHCREHWLPFLEARPLQMVLRHGRETPARSHFLALFDRTGEIDEQCFGNLSGFKEISHDLAMTWVEVCPDIYTFLVDELGDRAVGYVNAMPLREDVFRRVIAGSTNDDEIRADDLLPFDMGEPVWLYLMSVAVEPGARRVGQGIYQEGFELLLSGVEEKLIEYWRGYGTRVREIGAVGWTPEGRRICEGLGLAARGIDRQANPTYSLAVDEAVKRPGRLGGLVYRLRERYRMR